MFEVLFILWAIGASIFILVMWATLEDLKENPTPTVSIDMLPVWLWKAWVLYLATIWFIVVPIVYFSQDDA